MSRHAKTETFGDRLRRAREAKRPKMTQHDLAVAASDISSERIASTDISRYETGRVLNPGLRRIAALAAALDVPVSHFTDVADHDDRLAALEDLAAQIWAGQEKIMRALALAPATDTDQGVTPEAANTIEELREVFRQGLAIVSRAADIAAGPSGNEWKDRAQAGLAR